MFDEGVCEGPALEIKSSCSGCGRIAKTWKLKEHIKRCEYQRESKRNGYYQSRGILTRGLLLRKPFFASRKNNIKFLGVDRGTRIKVSVATSSKISYTIQFSSMVCDFKYTIKSSSLMTSTFRIPKYLMDEESWHYSISYRF